MKHVVVVRIGAFVCAIFLPLLATGCGPGNLPTSKVTGKLTYNGQPVKGGTLNFVPVKEMTESRTGTAVVEADGTFVASTYKPGDGLVIGRHKLIYAPPVGELKTLKPGESQKLSEYAGLVTRDTMVDVKPGDENNFKLELTEDAR